MNARLRAAIIAARAENMPKDNIERAIKKAAGADGENYEDIRYEGYGPGGAALIVEAQTDNRNRTASDVRSAFTKSGGSLAETGAVAFMFDRVGVIAFPAKVADADTMLEAAIEAGADDVSSGEDGHEVVCAAGLLRRGRQGAGGPFRRAEPHRPDLEGAEHHRRRRRDRREADPPRGGDRGSGRRPARLRQLRPVRRADGQAAGLSRRPAGTFRRRRPRVRRRTAPARSVPARRCRRAAGP